MAYKLDGTRFKAWTDAGAPLVGGKLYTYSSGTTTPKATYTDSTQGSANTNPIILDARGEADVWLGSGAYTFLLQTSAGVTVDTEDGVVDPQAAAESAIRADLASTAAGKGSKLVAFIQRLTGAVARWTEDKLSEVVSFEDFGAIGNGAADDTAAIVAAINSGRPIRCPGANTYLFNGHSTISVSVNIDLNGSTLKRASGTGGFFASTAGNFRLVNGVLDGQNMATNFSHLINFDSAAGSFELRGMTIKRNIVGGGTPTASQDVDLVYINRAARVDVHDNTFTDTSRNGVSLVGAVPEVHITGNRFEGCYLFGIDVEPNTSTANMYENVFITGNTFKNCGPQSNTNKVWNSGGPFAIASGTTATLIVRDLVIDGNSVISDSYTAPDAGVEPYVTVQQFENCTFRGNVIQNIDRLLFATADPAAAIQTLVISGNTLDTAAGTMGSVIYAYNADFLNLSGNTLSAVQFDGTTATFSGNTFIPGNATFALKANSSNPLTTIVGNSFNGIATCIDITNKTSGYTIIGNSAIGHTTFIGYVTNSQVFGNNDGGLAPVKSATFTISVPTATTTTILALAGAKKAGLITVQDAGGTTIGAHGIFSNFYDGGTSLAFLSGVQNSSTSGSALTLSGTNLQFAHTWGSTRTMQVSVLYFN